MMTDEQQREVAAPASAVEGAAVHPCPECGGPMTWGGQHHWLWNRPADQQGIQFRVRTYHCEAGHVWFMEDPPVSDEALSSWVAQMNEWHAGNQVGPPPAIMHPVDTLPDSPHPALNVRVGFRDQ